MVVHRLCFVCRYDRTRHYRRPDPRPSLRTSGVSGVDEKVAAPMFATLHHGKYPANGHLVKSGCPVLNPAQPNPSSSRHFATCHLPSPICHPPGSRPPPRALGLTPPLRVTLRVGAQKAPVFMHLLTGLRLQYPQEVHCLSP